MLRPATPLTILFLIAFALLLISTISVPIVKQIPLGKFTNDTDVFTFGVFGYCGPDFCSPFRVGYEPANITDHQGGEVRLPSTTRHSLSSILIVHPIAAFMTLVCTVLSGASHFRGPAHSPRYLLGLLILTFPTLLITLLAFLVDVLLFIPNLQWGGWIVLAATIIIVVCSVLTCAIRRTLVSRKARKERIEKNAEMNGETYYANRIADQEAYASQQAFARAESPPPMESKPINQGVPTNKSPTYASYEYGAPRGSNDDRVPLTGPTGSMRSFGSNDRHNGVMGEHGSESGRMMGPMIAGAALGREGMRDGDRSPVSPMDPEDSARRRPSDPRSGHRGPMPPPSGRSGPPPFYGSRGRGGYPPKGRTYPPPPSAYPPRGHPPPRGPPRGGYMRGGPQGMRGPPPPGWNGDGPPMVIGGSMRGPSRGPPPGYQNGYYESDEYYRGGSFDRPTRSNPSSARPSQDRQRPTLPGGWPSNDDVIQDYGYDRQEEPIRASSERRRQSPGPPSAPGYDRSRSVGSRQGDYERGLPGERQTSSTRDPTSFGFSGRQPSPAQSANGRQPSPPPPMPPVMHDYPPGQAIDYPPGQAIDYPPGQAIDYPPGQAIEMDAHSGSPAPGQQHFETGQVAHHYGDSGSRGDNSPGTYLPRSAWQAEPTEMIDNGNQQRSNDGPVELPGHAISTSVSEKGHRPRKSSDAYYEDVEPRFSSDEPAAQQNASNEQPPIPSSLQPGGFVDSRITSSVYSDPVDDRVDSRSPVYSDQSDFTSISQRGVNPNWQPPVGTKAATWKTNEAILAANPDFEVPGAGSKRTRGGSGGGSMDLPRGHAPGMSGTHRYPDPL